MRELLACLAVLSIVAAAARAELVRVVEIESPNPFNPQHWVVRDTETNLDWLALNRSLGASGAADWLAVGQGWRYATTAEVCDLFTKHQLLASGCPGSMTLPAATQQDPRIVQIFRNLGMTHTATLAPNVSEQAIVGIFRGSSGQVDSLARVVLEVTSAPNPQGVVVPIQFVTRVALADPPVNFPPTRQYGHFLVRSAPGIWPADWPTVSAASQREPGRFGAFPYQSPDGSHGVSFRVWSPGSYHVAVLDHASLPADVVSASASAGNLGFTHYLVCEQPHVAGAEPCPGGIWSGDVPGAAAGQTYRFLTAIGADGSAWTRRDPAARKLLPGDTNQPSVIYDPNESLNSLPHVWTDTYFTRPRPQELVIFHAWFEQVDATGEIGPGGRPLPANFDLAIGRLDLIHELGFNAVQFTPITESPTADDYPGLVGSIYEGLLNPYFPKDPFAVETLFGGPEGYKRFVDEAHRRGIAVHQDVEFRLWNDLSGHTLQHFDGEESDTHPLGAYFWDVANLAPLPQDDWPRPNVAHPVVKEFLHDNLRTWLEEYHVDGFRFDSIGSLFCKLMILGACTEMLPDAAVGRQFLREMNARVDAHSRVVSIAENIWDDDLDPTDPNYTGFDARWWVGDLTNDLAAWPLDPAAIANWLERPFMASFEQVHYFGDVYRPTGFPPLLQRIASDGNSGCGAPNPQNFVPCTHALKRFGLAAAIQLTAPGIPLIADMTPLASWDRGSVTDWNRRIAFPGTWQLFKTLIHLRRDVQDGPANAEDVPAYTGGLIGAGIHVTQQSGGMLVYHRWNRGGPGDDVVVVANLANAACNACSFEFPAPGAWRVRVNTDATVFDPGFGGGGPQQAATVTAASASGAPPYTAAFDVPALTAIVLSQDCVDSDGDLVCDGKDDCVNIANPKQRDADADGYGNRCDPDYNNDGVVGIVDFALFRSAFGSHHELYDLTEDGIVGGPDFGVFGQFFGHAPGPSGLDCAGTVPCTGP